MLGTALRKFLYLDDDICRDYLSALEGGIAEDRTVTELDQTSRGVGGRAGVSGVYAEAKRGSDTSRESTSAWQETSASRFQRVLDTLSASEAIGFYSQFDHGTWVRATGRDSILECDVELHLPQIRQLTGLANQISRIADQLEPITGESLIDSNSRKAVDGLNAIGELDERGVPLRMDLVDSPKFKLVSFLNPNNLRVSESLLSGEARVLCKVKRVLEKGQSIELSGPGDLVKKLPRSARRSTAKAPKELSAIVRAPATVVTTVAIYI